jgi:deoxyribose-phosphate aldolase
MNESFIQKVTKETMERLKNSSSGSRPLLMIFMGGDREVQTALDEVKKLKNSGIRLDAYLSKAGERIITRNRVVGAGIDNIIDDQSLWDKSALEKYDAIVVPVLTLNGLSKVANMIADNAVTNILLLALRHSKPIVFARDSVVCCGGPEPASTSFYMRKIEEMLNGLKNMGARVTVAKNLCRETCDLLNVKLPLKGMAASLSSADDPMIAQMCTLYDGDCSACGYCVTNREDEVRQIIDAGASRVASKASGKTIAADIARMIDHTALKAEVTPEQIGELCEEARKYGFATVCVNPANVKMASQLLKGSEVGITTVIGFPLGASTPTVKALEARDAIANGADEIDMVINVGALKGGNYQLVEDDIKAVREATRGKVLKVILETALLNDDQKIKACRISKAAGADFVKTSTGFGPGGATAHDIALMRKTVGPELGVKASGGVRTQQDAIDMVEAGATRIGASASVAIVSGGKSDSDY